MIEVDLSDGYENLRSRNDLPIYKDDQMDSIFSIHRVFRSHISIPALSLSLSSNHAISSKKKKYISTCEVKMKAGAVMDDGFAYDEETYLTVCKTSLFFAGDGFIVYDCSGQLVFRVDSYGGPGMRDKGEIVLMDAAGHCLLTVRRKRPSLHNRWEGYIGERDEGSKPIFSVKKSSIIGRSGLTVEMYNNPGEEYQIEGSFQQRCCRIYDSGNGRREMVAEIRRKVDASSNVVLGKDVFWLCLKPGFDGAFAMGLVLVLDRIDGGEDGGVLAYLNTAGAEVCPANDDEHENP